MYFISLGTPFRISGSNKITTHFQGSQSGEGEVSEPSAVLSSIIAPEDTLSVAGEGSEEIL